MLFTQKRVAMNNPLKSFPTCIYRQSSEQVRNQEGAGGWNPPYKIFCLPGKICRA